MPIDVSRPRDFEAAARTVEVEWGGLDVLLNNADILDSAPLQDIRRGATFRSLGKDKREGRYTSGGVAAHAVRGMERGRLYDQA
jgi:NAD(P)-dependent dehydrogenase (short-subunit alcohol dehydrogenase family)